MAVQIVDNSIYVSCPDVHPEAAMTFAFQRTLRVPDDGTNYDLPPGLGRLAVRNAGDGSSRFMVPMWQSEACWIRFEGRYPFLVTMSSGNINVITGETWSSTPDFDAEDYLEVPTQPWLDGFAVENGKVRQFVAAPLGTGHTVEEQLSSEPTRGGIQVAVYPLLASKYEPVRQFDGMICCSPPVGAANAMGLGAGGSISQAVATPAVPHDSWDLDHGQQFTVDIVNSAVWQELTGTEPASLPLSAAEYTRYGMPWFTWYDDMVPARQGSSKLRGARTVATADADAEVPVLHENEGFHTPAPVVVKG